MVVLVHVNVAKLIYRIFGNSGTVPLLFCFKPSVPGATISASATIISTYPCTNFSTQKWKKRNILFRELHQIVYFSGFLSAKIGYYRRINDLISSAQHKTH
jgi:hypothetical protein